MPRKARKNIIAPETLYHVTGRGNNQKRIFRAARDYKKMLNILRKTKEKYPFYFYTYNLMPNHYHFGIETIKVPVSKIMHQINNDYVKYFRRRYNGSGHLFQDRYFANVIDKDSYLWELVRYIDLNAFRAGIVEKPDDYRWSSYLVYFKPKHKDNLIDRDRFLSHYIDEDLEKARLAYLKFIKEGIKDEKAPSFLLDKPEF